ncbi:hypothetical protein, partial [Vibrio parahaemolyticus]|uniref:hypothetical protein n=1 Tax=Vibrio parahaemolyticus TaxID=670 RepID=UPI001C5FAE6A
MNFSNSGYSNGSLSLDTTAIFTKDEAYLTDKSFDSYLIAKNNIYNINDDTSDLGIISVKENG